MRIAVLACEQSAYDPLDRAITAYAAETGVDVETLQRAEMVAELMAALRAMHGG